MKKFLLLFLLLSFHMPSSGWALTPNDPDFNLSWGLNNTGQEVLKGIKGAAGADINILKAWDITQGDPNLIIAVIDSGVDYNHPDLKNNIWINEKEIPGNGIDDDGNGYIDDIRGWNFVDNNPDTIDANGHGTFVAGIIAAEGNNNFGTSGVMWRAKIMIVKLLDTEGFGDSASVIKAIQYAVDNGAKIINASWGGIETKNSALEEAINYALGKKSLFITAAGNEGNNNDTKPMYPASYHLANMIVVSSSDMNDNLSFFSNYGKNTVDIAAPGEYIYNTIPGREIIYENDFDAFSPLSRWEIGGTKNTWGITDEVTLDKMNSLTDNPYGNYTENTDSYIISPVLDLKDQGSCSISYFFKSRLGAGAYMVLEGAENKNNWAKINEYRGKVFATIIQEDLSEFEGKENIYLRFRLVTGQGANSDGVYIDDLKITCRSDRYSGNEFAFEDGTSMATPFVTGLAGLVLSQNPGFSFTKVKGRILCSGKKLSSLINKINTQSRIDAYRALSGACGRIQYPNSEAGVSGVVVNIAEKKEHLIITADDGYFFLDLPPGEYTLTPFRDKYTFSPKSKKVNLSNEGQILDLDFLVETKEYSLKSEGCFIATAAFGTPLASEVLTLREFRDRFLTSNFLGRKFTDYYYRVSPPIADFISRHESLKLITRIILLPVILAVKIILHVFS